MYYNTETEGLAVFEQQLRLATAALQ